MLAFIIYIYTAFGRSGFLSPDNAALFKLIKKYLHSPGCEGENLLTQLWNFCRQMFSHWAKGLIEIQGNFFANFIVHMPAKFLRTLWQQAEVKINLCQWVVSNPQNGFAPVGALAGQLSSMPSSYLQINAYFIHLFGLPIDESGAGGVLLSGKRFVL